MKKRSLALFCAFVMIFSAFAMSIQAAAAEEQYKVGYSIQDMNPWTDSTHTALIEGLGLSGRGAGDNGRGCTGIADDNLNGKWFGEFWADTNGNGITDNTGTKVNLENGEVDTIVKGEGYDEGDGLQTTCTAITDNSGYTALFITVDALGAYRKLTNDIRAQIIKSIKETPDLWKNDSHPNAPVVSPEGITVSGSHTHSSFRFSDDMYGTYPEGEPTSDANKYYKYVVDQIVLAAQEAWKDSAAATMYKNSVDVSEVLDGNYQMNFVRQWNRTYYATVEGVTGRLTYKVVEGSNFGTEAGIVNYLAKRYNVDPKKVKVEKKEYSEFATGRRDSTPLASKNGEILPADDMMHLIEFRYDKNQYPNKMPVVMLNWRAHTTENGSDFYGAASSDYVGPLRTLLAEKGYRVAFFLGAAGNLVIEFNNSQGRYLTPWYGEKTSKHGWSDVHPYAELLTEAAMTVLGSNEGKISAGEIRVIASRFAADRRTYTTAQKEAVEELVAKYRIVKNAETGEYDDSKWRKDWAPYPYIATNGTVINSYFEAGCIYDRRNNEPALYNISLTAISLGDNAAFVTAPYELSDRYYSDAALSAGDLTDNLWEMLNTVGSFGTPFVLSCTNDYVSYLPSRVEYIYNTKEFSDTFNQAKDGSTIFGAGSYESHITPVKAEAGEMMVEHFKKMLTTLSENKQREAYCEHCNENVIWYAVYNDTMTGFGSGHFYLAEDITRENGVRLYASENLSLCIDLNGKVYEVDDRALHPLNNSVLSVFDSAGGGKVISHAVDATYGAAVVIAGSAEFNWYGGTLACDATPTEGSPVARAVYAYGKINVYGGTIKSGSVYGTAKAPCVYLADNVNAKITLSGNATVDEIYFSTPNRNRVIVDELKGKYIGTAGLAFDRAVTTAIGTGSAAAAERLSVIKPEGYAVQSVSNQLKLVKKSVVNEPVSIGNTNYQNLGEALKVYQKGQTIVLKSDVTQSVTLNEDTYIDLNGHDITGQITVASDKTLYGMDSQTNDYTIEDGAGYGKITQKVNGSVQGASVRLGAQKDYMKITEGTAISFHRVNLNLTHVTISVRSASMTYKCMFEGDSKVAENVAQYGVAFNLEGAPSKDAMPEGTYSYFSDFTAGPKDATANTPGTYVVGIMKEGQTDYLNGCNAKSPIYGSAYVKTVDGEYYFGKVENKSFREAVCEVNGMWSTLDELTQNAVVEMYETFESNMKYWGLDNIMNAAN